MALQGVGPRKNGQLRLSNRKQIQTLIGSGNKQFRLLFSAYRDGCSAATFHKLCDHKGPTLTMFYNAMGTVFGGYTSMSWCSKSTHIFDDSAMLLQLKLNGELNVKSFKCSNPAHAIYCNAAYGPTFGAYGLLSFTVAVAKSSGTLPLNGKFTGESYDMNGVTAADFCNDAMTVTDLEVYNLIVTATYENAVWLPDVPDREKTKLLDVEWRKSTVDWTSPLEYTKYRILSSETNKKLAFQLCDSRGLEPDHLMSKELIRLILEGHLPDKCQLDYKTTIASDHPGFVKYPGLDENIHCVLFCVDASLADGQAELIPEVIQNIKDMQIVMNYYDIPQVVVLTKVDSVCQLTKNNIANVFRSQAVEQCVNKVAEDLGLPRNLVLPMKNYENEGELDDNINILTLLTIREILHNCDAHLFNHHDEIMKDFSRRPGASD